jgi:Cof subfamily protein (haloacid dehalogenase superfamily)
MKFDMIALDVDGTLLNDQYELTPKTREAVTKASESGAVIVLCTGRGPANTLPILEELGLEGIVITHNGAAVVQSRDRSVLHEVTFEAEEIRSLAAYCRETGLHFDLHAPFDLYIETMTEPVKAMYEKFMLKPVFVPDVAAVDANKVKMSIFGPQEWLDVLEREWDQIGCGLRKIRSGLNFIDVQNPEATKGHALKELAKDLAIPQSRVLAVGNYYNDQEMIEWAGLGIAMANSPEPLKRIADAVTASNNEDGVYSAIMTHFFG